MLSMLFLNCLYIPLPSNTQQSGFYPAMFLKLLSSKQQVLTSITLSICSGRKTQGGKSRRLSGSCTAFKDTDLSFVTQKKGQQLLPGSLLQQCGDMWVFHLHLKYNKSLIGVGGRLCHDDNRSSDDVVLSVVLFQTSNQSIDALWADMSYDISGSLPHPQISNTILDLGPILKKQKQKQIGD